MNRLAEEDDDLRRAGSLCLDEEDVFTWPDPVPLRRRVGLVGDRPVLFRGSLFDNVAFGLRVVGLDERECARRVEQALRRVDLWEALGPRLDRLATDLPAGDRQRLCLARALALDPDVLLLDQPSRRLDPVATAALEEVILRLRTSCTVLLSTHDLQQAGRLADVTAFLDRGTVVEAGPTEDLFTRPRDPATEAYLSRRYVQ